MNPNPSDAPARSASHGGEALRTAAGQAPVVLVVEDEAQIRRFVALALQTQGCQVIESDSLQRGLIDSATQRPDLLILDLGLPDGDGMSLLRELRSWSTVPVIVLSARSAESAKIAALDAGADDYLAKPFGTGELLARVRAQLRRQAQQAAGTQAVVEFGDIRLDLARRMAWRAGTVLRLTPIEYRLLSYLVSHPDCVLTHRQLLLGVWGPAHIEDAHYVRIYMGQLRRKIEADPARPRHLLTESGVGYRFAP